MAKRKKPTREQLFSPVLIRSRISLRRQAEHSGEDTKQFAVRTGVSDKALYKKEKEGAKTPYQQKDIIKIGNAEGAPLLWPLLDWDLAKEIDDRFFEPDPKDKKP